MATFILKYRSKGKVMSAKLTANNLEAAKRQATRFGSVLSITRDSEFGKKRGMNSADRYTFLTRLATMLGSRMATADALRMIRDSFQGTVSDAAMRLLERLNAGVDLPSAISEEKMHFPGPVGMIIKVAAKSGQIHTALKDAAAFEQRMAAMKTGSGRTIMSAAFGFLFAVVLVLGSVFYVGPEIMKIGLIAENKDKIDIGWVNTMAEVVAIIIGIAGAGMAFLLWLGTMGRKVFPEWADGVIMKIPFYNDIVLSQENYLVLRRLSLMIGSGVRVEEALISAQETTAAGILKKSLGEALSKLRSGQKWSSALTTLHPTDRAALALAADRTQIAENLNMIAEQAQALYVQRINSFAPMLMVISALAVTLAGIVLFGQTMLPMLQIAAGLLDTK